MNPSRTVWHVALALLFAVIYVGCYVRFLNYWFEYAGYTLYQRDPSFIGLTLLVTVLPVVFYRGIRATSSVLAAFVYVLLYVPIILTFGLGSARPIGEILVLQLAFMASMCLLFMSDWFVIRNPINVHSRLNLVPWALAMTVAGTLYVLLVYRSNLRFSTFGADLYSHRATNEQLGAGVLTRYLSAWLSTVLVPLCLAYGLVARRMWYFAAGTVACLAMYLANAAKIVLLFPFIYLAFWVVFRNGRLRAFFAVLVLGLSATLVGMIAVAHDSSSTLFLATSILINRTIGNGGQLTMAYYDFFSSHRQTGYAHISGIKQLTGAYPYGSQDLGHVIGEFYWSPEMNANANFWATDGFAAMGLAGLGVATVMCAVLFVLINSVTNRYDRLFVALCLLPFVVQLLNTSLFTATWSGGAAFLLLFFLFNRENAPDIRPPKTRLAAG